MDKSLIKEWLFFKQLEGYAAGMRRDIEAELVQELDVPEQFESVINHELEGYKIKVTGRINRKVDADKIQDIATEHGLVSHLGMLFRWKPEINMKEWKASDESITRPFADAITATPAKPSFKIEEM